MPSGEGGDAAERPERVVCATCGATVAGADALATVAGADALATARLTWARGVENGRAVWTCERCSRSNLRSIEGKLDSSWW